MNCEKIRKLTEADSLIWTDHVIQRIAQRGISRKEIKHALAKCEVIELYPNDYPYPSCLVFGQMFDSSPLHTVCGVR